MEEAIVRKLRAHLSGGIVTECHVVYLLAQVRKLLEGEHHRPKPFALKMYCHWALHINLTNPNTTGEFLRRVDQFVQKTIHPYAEHSDAAFSSLDEHRLFREFVYLDNFRSELRELLHRYNLPDTLCEANAEWFKFITAYAGVIEDGELSVESRGHQIEQGWKRQNIGPRSDQHSVTVKKVVFRKGDAPTFPGSHVPFSVRWDIHLRDGGICEAQLSANEDATGIAHRLSIRGSDTARIRWTLRSL
jgi:hypothetical protein